MKGPLVAALVLVLANMPTPAAHAGTLGSTFVRFDRLQTSSPTTGTVCASPATTNAENDVQVTFPTSYSLGVAGTFTVDTTNKAWPSGATGWLGIGTATNVTGQVVTFPSSDLTPSTLYCFNWINSAAVSISSSATSTNQGTVATRTSAPAVIDSSLYTTTSVTNDQVTISATVPEIFSFSVSSTSDALGTLSAGSVTTSPTPRTVTISTNAGSGWTTWAKDTNTGLTSTIASTTIPSKTPGTNSTLTAGTAAFNTGVTSSQVGGTGSITVATPFVGTSAGQGGGLDTTLRTIASSNGTADTAVLTIKNNVAISATTPAASDYADTITFVGASVF